MLYIMMVIRYHTILLGILEGRVMPENEDYHDASWFTGIYSKDKERIIAIQQELGMGHPLEYESAVDFLLDVYESDTRYNTAYNKH